MDSWNHSCKGKTKVKTGCRTCKIRKVKCDEGRPACRRCVSTGRSCDGYGIWGGGGSGHTLQDRSLSLRSNRGAPRSLPSAWAIDMSEDEIGYLDWFKCRTTAKLPGTFASRFWDTLLLQACLNEPAVLHTVLALSSFHKWGTIDADCCSNIQRIPHKQEKFMLQHYIKAIGLLRAPSLIKDKGSLRTALIVCVVFISLELLRGHIETAQTHLQNGLRVLEMQMISRKSNGVLYSTLLPESDDHWIFEAFARLQLQIEMFKYTFQHPCLVLQIPNTGNLVKFRSTKEAWQELDRLFNQICSLTDQARQQVESRCESQQYPLASLVYQQESIQTNLTHWLELYIAYSKLSSLNYESTEEQKGFQLLCAYHSMASIMVATCLQPNNELQFDSHTNQFAVLLQQLIDLWILSTTNSPIRTLPKYFMGLSGSTVDVGWVPPLFYVAIKCRVHRIRLQAIKLLQCSSHREGIWDSKATARIARKVMELEERDWYQGTETADDFLLCDPPCPQDLSLPTIPGFFRMREIEVNLLGAPTDRVLLFCKQKQHGFDRRVLVSEFNMRTQRWVDVK